MVRHYKMKERRKKKKRSNKLHQALDIYAICSILSAYLVPLKYAIKDSILTI